ncbi:MAG: PilZ domain-containing protein [Lachnospiraceae bacterium]|nr:PilZ domain-containing protein [Lachnospiraceae bacterium]
MDYNEKYFEKNISAESIIELVKDASNSIVDGATVVRELEEENRDGAAVVVNSMEELAGNTQMLNENVTSTMEGTKEINNQVANLTDLLGHIVQTSEKSTVDAVESLGEVENALQAAGEIEKLAGSIQDAVSGDAAKAVADILQFASQIRQNMQNVNESIGMIAEDCGELCDEIQMVDETVKKVEESNNNMAGNVKQMQNIMGCVMENVIDCETIAATMLSKYEETLRNVEKIENVVEKLVEELGEGGFMSLDDVVPGMKVVLTDEGSGKECHTEVAAVQDGKIMLGATKENTDYFAQNNASKYEVRIIVNNAMYIWKEQEVTQEQSEENFYRLMLEGKPKVVNRRKYPRLAMENACDVYLKAKDLSFPGKMINISAGGFAVSCMADEFADAIGEKIRITIPEFELTNARQLSGTIIRTTKDREHYIIGCRMPEDNMEIRAYVEKQLK